MALKEYDWTLGFGAALFFLNCCVLGDQLLCSSKAKLDYDFELGDLL